MIVRAKKLLNTAIVFSLISSLPILGYGSVGIDEQIDSIVKVIFPVIFWIGLAGEQICFWLSWHDLKKSEAAICNDSKPGILSVFQTRPGKIADLILTGSATLLIVLMIADIGKENIQLILLFSTVLSFRMHCILNGRNYKYIQKKGKDDVHD